MNINPKDILNTFLYNNLTQNIDLESNNTLNEILENISQNTETNKNNNIPVLNSNDELKILLNSLNQAPSKENIEFIKILVQNNLPINKENLENIIKSSKMFKDFPIEKALFLIQNNMKPTISLGEQIDKYISKDTLINNQIEDLFNNISLLIKEDKNLILKDMFKNTSFENIANNNFKNLEQFKLQILDEFNENKFQNLNNIFNKISNNNIDKNEILKQILNFNFNKDLLIDFEKLNNLENIFDKNEFKNLDNSFKEIFNDLKLDKDSTLLLQREIFNIIKSNPKLSENFKSIIKEFSSFQNKVKFFNFENSSNENLNEYFETLSTISKNLKNTINNFADKNSENITNSLDNLNKNIDFMNNLKNSTFLQIPLNINNFYTTAEIFVFSNKKNKNQKSKNNSGSALISLNLLYLGKLEVFINKINNDVSCQFRLEKESTKNLVSENVDLLNNFLKNKNLNLKDISFKELNESFSIISNIKNTSVSTDFKLSNFKAKA